MLHLLGCQSLSFCAVVERDFTSCKDVTLVHPVQRTDSDMHCKLDINIKKKRIAKMIYEYFLVEGTHESVLDFCNLFSITLRGVDVQRI